MIETYLTNLEAGFPKSCNAEPEMLDGWIACE